MKRGRNPDGDTTEEEEFVDDEDDDDDDDDDDDPNAYVASDGDSDDGGGGRRITVNQRLNKVKTTFPVDRDRSLVWALGQVGDADRRLQAAMRKLQALEQPSSLRCVLHDYQVDGLYAHHHSNAACARSLLPAGMEQRD